MAEIRGDQCRQCRREGGKLFLKGTKCFTAKCPVEKRNAAAPGQHGQRKGGRLTDYGVMLREKQKVRRIYGILEEQFSLYYKEADRQSGPTGQNLLRLLESRLDNIIYRMGFGLSRRQSRQMISHKAVQVNGATVNIPSFLVKPGDIVSIAPHAHKHLRIKESLEFAKQKPESDWLSVDQQKLEGKLIRYPERMELPSDINEKLIVEFYSK